MPSGPDRARTFPARDGAGDALRLSDLTAADARRRGRSATLSPRETDCLTRLVQGLTDQEIANDLAITHATVRFHLDGARRKINARSRAHLAALAVALGVAAP